MPVYSGYLRINPANVRYSQDSVAGTFRDGKRIEHTFRQLLYGDISVDNIPVIQVIRDEQGVYWAHTGNGNRRLYVFKRLQILGIVLEIPVDVQDVGHNFSLYRKEMTTVNNGTDITVRQSIAVTQIDKIEAEWLRTTGRQRPIIRPSVAVPLVQNEVAYDLSRLSLSQPNESDAFRSCETILERYRREEAAERKKREEEERKNRAVMERAQQLKMRQLQERLEAECQEELRLQRLERQLVERQRAERLERQSRQSSSYYKYVDGRAILITRQNGG